MSLNKIFSSDSKSQGSKKKLASDYTAKDIEVLEGLEPVRKRPGMYIGGTDTKALHHLVAEVLDNAMDEVVAGYANRIDIIFDSHSSLSISDNGRGIPTDPHPKFPDLSAVEVILTTLHSGGKFNDQVYSTAGGLHGVGISVVNALSQDLVVDIWRGQSHWTQRYSRGKPTTMLTQKDTSQRKKGTRIWFSPDPTIFPDPVFDPVHVWKMAQAKAFLYKGVEIHWTCPKDLISAGSNLQSKAVIHFPKGLEDYLQTELGIDQHQTRPGDGAEEVDQGLVFFSGNAPFTTEKGRVEWAMVWCFEERHVEQIKKSSWIRSFCNTIPTPLGGAHEVGVRQALLRSFRDYAGRLGKKASLITADDIYDCLFAVVSVFISQPQFQGQTKEKLTSPHATRLVEGVIKDHLDHWLAQHHHHAQWLLQYFLDRAEERAKAKKNEVARASVTKRLRLTGKLSDCTNTNPQECEIFLVEGDSAGGSAKQARSRAIQAVLPLKGKILNVATASLDKLRANQEIRDLINALGCGSGKDCNPSKLRYHRVVIMTDADVDGAHIASLLLTFFFLEMRSLIEAGHIFLAQPPLYRLSHQHLVAYAQSDEHRDQLLRTQFKRYSKIDISRFKGLGEMSAEQLKSTTMDPTKRTLLRVRFADNHEKVEEEESSLAINPISLGKKPNPRAIYEDLVNRLMGKKPQERFDFIQANAVFVRDIDA